MEVSYVISIKNDNMLSAEGIQEYYDTTSRIVTLKPGYIGYVVFTYSIDVHEDNKENFMNVKIISTIEFPFTQTTN